MLAFVQDVDQVPSQHVGQVTGEDVGRVTGEHVGPTTDEHVNQVNMLAELAESLFIWTLGKMLTESLVNIINGLIDGELVGQVTYKHICKDQHEHLLNACET